jgi:hypothetical protein
VAERAAWDYIERADGSTQLTTVLPGAIFGPALSADNFGSLQTLSRMLEGRVPRYPSLAFEVVDVRDVADLHIRAMIAPEAEGERLIATGELLRMGEMAAILREQLGPAAAKVPPSRCRICWSGWRPGSIPNCAPFCRCWGGSYGTPRRKPNGCLAGCPDPQPTRWSIVGGALSDGHLICRRARRRRQRVEAARTPANPIDGRRRTWPSRPSSEARVPSL